LKRLKQSITILGSSRIKSGRESENVGPATKKPDDRISVEPEL